MYLLVDFISIRSDANSIQQGTAMILCATFAGQASPNVLSIGVMVGLLVVVQRSNPASTNLYLL
jgi:hypothetical protein